MFLVFSVGLLPAASAQEFNSMNILTGDFVAHTVALPIFVRPLHTFCASAGLDVLKHIGNPCVITVVIKEMNSFFRFMSQVFRWTFAVPLDMLIISELF